MVIAAVEERDLDGSVFELTGCAQTTETSADDYNSMAVGHGQAPPAGLRTATFLALRCGVAAICAVFFS